MAVFPLLAGRIMSHTPRPTTIVMVNDPYDVRFGGGDGGGPTVGAPRAGVGAAVIPDVDDGGAPPAPITPRNQGVV